ncbi:MAG: threonine synthase [Pseudomonadota bacterium]
MAEYILKCIDCDKEYLPGDVDYLCPECEIKREEGRSLKGVLRVIYDYDRVKRDFNEDKLSKKMEEGFVRYFPLLPVHDQSNLPEFIPYRTPLRRAVNLAHEINLSDLWLKDDTVLPSASFKDRASLSVVSMAREYDRKKIVVASTGNAASSLAAVAASVGMESIIIVPESAPKAKLAQIAITGARLIPIMGSYDDAFELSLKASKEFGWYNRNTAYNPFTIEGKKTAALEIWEQLEYSIPDKIIIPVGDGCILAGIEKGFSDLLALGFIDRLPQLIAVQATGSSAIVDAFEKGEGDVTPLENASSIADSIVVNAPRNARWALKSLKITNGMGVLVSDEEILEGMRLLASTTGIFAEPAAAATIAGLIKLEKMKMLEPDDLIVALITGHGLKDIVNAQEAVSIPKAIEPDIDVLKRVLE